MFRAQILFIAILACLAFYVTRVRTRLYDRLAYVAILAVGGALVVWPQLSISAAHALGISRGADLMFYLAVLFGLFYAATSSAKTRELERGLTNAVRQLALLQARAGPASSRTDVPPGPAAGGRTDN